MAILTSRKRRQPTLQQRIVASKEAEGVEVVILVKGLYNGPNHKSLGWLEPGALVRVAANGYADSLIADGFACRPDDLIDEEEFADLVENMEPLEPEPEPEPSEPEPVTPLPVVVDEDDPKDDLPDLDLDEPAEKPRRRGRPQKA